jgi:signal transduction histidine kinase
MVRTFTERANGDLLITSFDGRVFEFAGARLVELPAPPGMQGQGYLGHADEAGQWWVVQDQFIGRWDGRHWLETLPVSNIGTGVIGAGTGHDGALWLLLEKELRKYRAGGEVARLALPKSPGECWSITEDSRSNVWIASANGISCASPSGQVRRWTTANGLSSNAIRFVFEDRELNLWVGTSGGGLQRFKPRRVQSFGVESGLTDRNVTSVSSDGAGGMWFATYGGGMFRWSGGAVTNVPLSPESNTFKIVNSVLTDHAGRTWFGALGDGVDVADSGGFHRIPPEQTGGLNVFSLFEDSHARIWVGGEANLSVGDGNTFQPLQDASGMSIRGVRYFAEDREGLVWLSNLENVFRYEKGRLVKMGGGGASLRDIGGIKADGDGTVWLAAHGGELFCWRAGRFKRIALDTDEPAPDVYGLLEDNAGYFWMASNRGVLRAARKDLLAAANGKASHVECRVLDLGDGLPSVECSGGRQPGCVRDDLGRLWFATLKGAAMIDPASFRLNTNPPPVQIEEVTYFLPRSDEGVEREVKIQPPFREKILLPPGSRRLEIHFTGLSFVAAEKVRFQVKLGREDIDWHEAGTRRVAYYYDLSPREYVFRVRAANNDGVWNETGASLAFAVQPFFWQTWWFRVAALAALVNFGGIAAWGQTRRRHQRELAESEKETVAKQDFARRLIFSQENERKRIAAELHDGLGQDVLLIKNRLALAAARKADPAELTSQLDAAIAATVRAVGEIRNISQALRPASLDQVGLTKSIEWTVEQLGESSTTRFSADVDNIDGLLSPEMEIHIFRTIQEGLNNIIRHAGAARAILEVKREEAGIRVSLFDDGRGFDAENPGDEHEARGDWDWTVWRSVLNFSEAPWNSNPHLDTARGLRCGFRYLRRMAESWRQRSKY